jgi:hypothetical protein
MKLTLRRTAGCRAADAAAGAEDDECPEAYAAQYKHQ